MYSRNVFFFFKWTILGKKCNIAKILKSFSSFNHKKHISMKNLQKIVNSLKLFELWKILIKITLKKKLMPNLDIFMQNLTRFCQICQFFTKFDFFIKLFIFFVSVFGNCALFDRIWYFLQISTISAKIGLFYRIYQILSKFGNKFFTVKTKLKKLKSYLLLKIQHPLSRY